MLFRTFEPYSDDYMNENTMCFICYEIKCAYEMQTITLKTQEDYIKICDCNGYVHNNCLKIWCDKSNKCPICRKDMYKRITIPMIIFNKGEYLYIFYFLRVFKNINKILRYLLICILLYFFAEFYVVVLNNKIY